jgi:putative protease
MNGKKGSEKMEIMSPAGDFECLQAALKAGADSIYFGSELNMRSRGAKNFQIKDLKEVCALCHAAGVKSYLTLNSIIYGSDLKLMREIVDAAKEAKIDAIIACDMAVIEYARTKGVRVHTSTQLNISNIEAVKFYSKYADAIVLARELTLEQITEICQEVKKQGIKGPSGEIVKIEIFIHGALCVSISGKCYMSLAAYNKSANRGECFQNCRRTYRVIDEETGEELVIDNKYVMSPRDLCTIGYLDKIIASGVSILKIEGRGRASDYVYSVTKVYKAAVQSCLDNKYTEIRIKKWLLELEKVFNRGFWHGGYYLGKENEAWAAVKGSKATTEKIAVGLVKHYFSKKKVAVLEIWPQGIKKGDDILITGEKTGVVNLKVSNIFKNGKPFAGKAKGTGISIAVDERVRDKDKVYLVREK